MELAVIVVCLVLVIRYFKKNRGRRSVAAVSLSAEARLTEEMLEKEKKLNAEIMELIRSGLVTSPYLAKSQVSKMINVFEENYTATGRAGFSNMLDHQPLLSVKEKKALGLNTRMKYSKSFIEFFDVASFSIIEPKAYIHNVYWRAHHRASSIANLERLRQYDFVKKVKLLSSNGEACSVKKKEFYNINEALPLPLPGCDAELCKCMYVAEIEG